MSETPPVINRIVLHPIAMPLVEPLQTSGWNDSFRPAVLVELHAGGAVGWGECVAGWTPGYSYETIGTALHVLGAFIRPALLGQPITQSAITPQFRGHPMAKAAIDMALADVTARLAGKALAASDLFSGLPDRKTRVEVGVSIGIQPSIDATLAVIETRLNEGYSRVKLKIKPGWDLDLLREVRRQHPHILLMADANSAYTLDQLATLKKFDAFNLMMIEQPLGYDDIYQHSQLQPHLNTPICLDESIHTVDDARLAVELGACRIINLKVSRLGGLHKTLALYYFCSNQGVPLWVGGMLETGVGRAANLILAGLPGFTLPSDISATNRYYAPDITRETFTLNAADSTIDVPTAPGLGVSVDPDRLAAAEAALANFPKSAFMGPLSK